MPGPDHTAADHTDRRPPDPGPAVRAERRSFGLLLVRSLEFLGRVVELALSLTLHPVLLAASRLWRSVLRRPFGRVASAVSPSSGPEPEPGPGAETSRDRTVPAARPGTHRRPGTEPDAAPDTGTGSGSGSGSEPGFESGAADRSVGPAGGLPARSAVRVAAAYLLVVGTAALLLVVRRVDSALRQMHVEGTSAGSALSFETSFTDLGGSVPAGAASRTVAVTRAGWQTFGDDVALAARLRDPFGVARSVIWLDVCFIALYLVLAAVLLVILYRLNARTAPRGADQDPVPAQEYARRSRMIVAAGAALAALVAVDVVEDIELYRALVRGDQLVALPGGLAIGPLASLLKVVLGVAVLAPATLVAMVLLFRRPSARRALSSLRGLGYGLAALAVLMMTGIGAAQLDDVIRAWDRPRAGWAVLACGILAVTVTGAARRLTGVDPENPRPDAGRPAQPLILGAGVALVAAGQLLQLAGQGWGLSVAGALLIGLWLLGIPFAGLPRWPDLAARPGWGLWAATGFGDTAPAAERAPSPAASLAIWGDRFGRLAGSAVPALLVLAIARATALDAYTRRPRDWGLLSAPVLAAVAIALWGAVIVVHRPGWLLSGKRLAATWWPWATMVALAGGVVLFQDSLAISGAQAVGTAAVLLGGFTLVIGLTALLVIGTRRGPITEYALAPALRGIRLRRFPVVTFLVLWILAESALDRGGYHDIRREAVRPADPAPSLNRAWADFAAAAPPYAPTRPGRPVPARPVVLVGAQGGGMRAAVWTSLVMECLFGPGPVRGTDDTCARRAADADPARLAANADLPLPVFLASGASGGSVGLAAWSARRADLQQDGATARTPAVVEDALAGDFIAPDIARLLLADLPRAFLAWDKPDRAEMLERGWEAAWRGPGQDPPPALRPHSRGMSRGLRQLWDVTHQGSAWGSPILALNGSSVEDGCRFVASAVDFALPSRLPDDPAGQVSAAESAEDSPDDAACRGPVRPDGRTVADVLPSTNELVDYLCPTEDVPLSTAAHLSARFPFVSPTGRIARRACEHPAGLVPMPAVSYDADGGFFDNSGAGTAVDAWRALLPMVTATQRAAGCVVPVFVQIDNSPPAATVASGTDSRPPELLAPLNATLGEISSREAYARAAAAAAFTRPVSASGRSVTYAGGGKPASLWFRVTLFGQPGPEPPLGWTLAPETVSDMRAQLRVKSNAEQIRQIRDLLEPGRLSCEETR